MIAYSKLAIALVATYYKESTFVSCLNSELAKLCASVEYLTQEANQLVNCAPSR